MKGKIQTVLGLIDPSDVGKTLTHEHLIVDASALSVKARAGHEQMARAPFTLRNFGWIQQYPYSHVENLQCKSAETKQAIIEELHAFKHAGGLTIVDNTTQGLSRDVTFLKDASHATGVNIVAGTGFYLHTSQDSRTHQLSEEDIAAVIRKELTEGCREDMTVKCGILGEIGTSWPITDFEKKSLRASASVSEQLGCPVMIHPGRSTVAPAESVRVFAEAGGSIKKLVMAHLDRTFEEKEVLLDFAQMGTYLEFDLFGLEKSYYQQKPDVSIPSDAQRIDFIKTLIEEGMIDRILISHDIHTKHRMSAFGGHGYSHILDLIVPMMLERHMTSEQIDTILITNPAKWLAFDK